MHGHGHRWKPCPPPPRVSAPAITSLCVVLVAGPEATTPSPETSPRTRTPPRAVDRCGRLWRRRSGRRGNRAPSERLEAVPCWPSLAVAADTPPRIPGDYLDTLGSSYALSSVARCRYRESKAFCCMLPPAPPIWGFFAHAVAAAGHAKQTLLLSACSCGEHFARRAKL